MSITSISSHNSLVYPTQNTQNERQNFTDTKVTSSISSVNLSHEFITGEDLELSLGRIALGGNSQLSSWEQKGLKISEQSLRAASDVFNEAMQNHFSSNNSSGVVMNRHQIVENHQITPQWFSQEKDEAINNIAIPSIKASFKDGQTYALNQENMQSSNFFKRSMYSY